MTRIAATLFACSLAAWAASPSLRPYSVQIHLHGSMSEGPGSMRGGNEQARKLGLDVLWWSDHDWRVAYHTYADGYDFEGAELTNSVPVPYPPGTDPSLVKGQRMQVALAPHKSNGQVKDTVARTTAERKAGGLRSFEVAAAAEESGRFQPFFYELSATRMRMKRSLASGVEVDLAIYPEIERDKKTMVGVRFDLSQQPPSMERGALIYVLTGLTDAELERLSTANVKYVRLDWKLHEWNRYTLKVTEDARRLRLGGEDNSLGAASFGVLTTGQRARAFFDDFHMRHRLGGEALRAKAREITAALEKEYGVTNYVGQEFSYQAHLNALGDVPMIDYAKNPLGLAPAESVAFAHRYGGIISLNHYFGGKREAADRRAKELIPARAFGADLLECNAGQLGNFLSAWDTLSAAGVYITGEGVSDSHTSQGGWFDGKNFVSWVWAKSKSQGDLIDGFRRGEVYFGDPAQYRGEVTVDTADGHRMGQVVATAAKRHPVRLRLTQLPEGTRVRIVVQGAPVRESVAQGTFESTVNVDTAKPAFVRVEAWRADGKPLVFSNPLYFRPADMPVEAASARQTGCRLTSTEP